MQEKSTIDQQFENLLSRAFQVLQDPLCDVDGEDYDVVPQFLLKVSGLQNKFENTTKLNDFCQLARNHFKYEVLPYGTVFIQDEYFNNKFYILLRGSIQILQSKPQKEIENEIKIKLKTKTK